MKKLIMCAILLTTSAAHAENVVVNWENPSDVHNTDSIVSVATETGLTMRHVKSLNGSFDVIDVSGQESELALEMLRQTGSFKHVEVLSMAYPPAPNEKGTFAQSSVVQNKSDVGTMSLPTNKFNDPMYLSQVHLNDQMVGSMGFSSLQKARDYAEDNNTLGRNVRVAVVDTGRWNHEDMNWADEEANFLDGRTFFQPFYECLRPDLTDSALDVVCPEFIINSASEPVVNLKVMVPSNNAQDKLWNQVNGEYKIDINGHGLSVASQIAATENNAKGFVGVVPSNVIDIIPVKALKTGGAPTTGIADAILWAAQEYQNIVQVGEEGYVTPISAPVDVINLSLGGGTTISCENSSYLKNAIEVAYSKNISVVVAAGNESMDTIYISPANCDEAFTVASNRDNGDMSSFSNYGTYVDVSMNGQEVLSGSISSLFYNRETAGIYGCGVDFNFDNCYGNPSGTSMSAPNVAATLALLRLTNPEATAVELEAMVTSTAKPYLVNNYGEESLASKLGQGFGVVNAYNAIRQDDIVLSSASDVTVNHFFDATNSDLNTSRVNAMKELVPNACTAYSVNVGALSHRTDDVSYVVYQTNESGALTEQTPYVKTVFLPEFVVNTSEYSRVGVSSCDDGECSDILELDFANIEKPESCM